MGAIVSIARQFGAWKRSVVPIRHAAVPAVYTPSAALLLCFLAAPGSANMHIPLLSAPAESRVQYYGIGAWRLRITTSLFSGDVRCRLYRHDREVIYKKSALGFRFDDDADTLQAWIKIDNRAARRWRDMLPALAAQDVPISGKNLDAPTDGIVWLPLSELEQARKVAIQLRPGKRPRLFSMGGFGDLLEAGRRLGCSPDERFLP